MPAILIALQIVLILFPGFAAAYIVQLLGLRGSQTDFDKLIEACLYSILIYAGFMLCAHGALPFEMVTSKPGAADSNVSWHTSRLLVLAGITVGFALAGVAYVNLDGNWIFRKLKMAIEATHNPVTLSHVTPPRHDFA